MTKIMTFEELNGFHVPGENAYVDLNMAVAMTLQYLSQERRFQGTAAFFGIAKSTAISGINNVMDILVATGLTIIRFPGTDDAWRAMTH